jgi:DNA polymerase I
LILVDNKAAFTSMVDALSRASILFLDTETTGFDPYTEKLIMIQLWDGEGEVYIIDMRKITAPKGLGKAINSYLEQVYLVGHNIKFDLQWLAHHLGLTLSRLSLWDTMIAEQYLFGLGMSEAKIKNISYALKACAGRRGVGMSKEERNWFIGLNGRGEEWDGAFPQTQLEYAELDVRALKRVYEDQVEELSKRGFLGPMNVEMDALAALAHVELSGVPVNQAAWREVIRQKEKEAAELYREVYGVFSLPILASRARLFEEKSKLYQAWEYERDKALVGLQYGYDMQEAEQGPLPEKWGVFKARMMKQWRDEHPNPGRPKISTEPANLGSTTQLLQALKGLGIEAKNTSSQTLEELEEDHPEVGILLQWRKAIKFSQSFGENLLEKINPITGRLHSSYQQIGASSGRMSAFNPNFQQIPSKGDGSKLRSCVQAPPGKKLLIADYSGQELMILADLSGDERMMEYIGDGVDLHAATARLMFNLGPDADTKKIEVAPGISARSAAKTINFGIAYGMSAFKLSKDLGCSKDRGEELMNAWYEAYPQARKWLLKQAEYALNHLKSTTVTGWIRQLTALPSEPTRPGRGCSADEWKEYQQNLRDLGKLKNRIRRQGMNTPIQGAAAGMTKLALGLYFNSALWYNQLVLKHYSLKIIAVVHDEIVIEISEEIAEEAARTLADCMDQAAKQVLKRVRVPHTEVKIAEVWEK